MGHGVLILPTNREMTRALGRRLASRRWHAPAHPLPVWQDADASLAAGRTGALQDPEDGITSALVHQHHHHHPKTPPQPPTNTTTQKHHHHKKKHHPKRPLPPPKNTTTTTTTTKQKHHLHHYGFLSRVLLRVLFLLWDSGTTLAITTNPPTHTH